MVFGKMPVVIKCKSCGQVIKELNAEQLANFNILMLNFGKCKNCGHVFNVDEAELRISALSQNPFSNGNNNNNNKVKKNKPYVYVLTKNIKNKLTGCRLKIFGGKLKCDMCGAEFKVGEKVVTLHHSRHTRRFHEKCYRKLMKKEFFVSPLRFSNVEQFKR